MEINFDMDNFEQSLKQHADEFSMIPSKRVWNGVYNSLHPGSKWPSLTMLLFFLLTLVGIGPLNNSGKDFTLTTLPDNNQQSYADEGERSLFNLKTLPENEQLSSQIKSSGKVISLKNKTEENISHTNSEPKDISPSIANDEPTPQNIAVIKKEQVEMVIPNDDFHEKSLENIPNTIIVNISDYNKNQMATSKVIQPEFEKSLQIDQFEQKNNISSQNQKSLTLLKINPVKPLLNKIENNKPESEFNAPNELIKSSTEVKKQNSKTTWIFFVTPSVTTTYFTGKDIENYNTPVNTSPLIVNPNQLKNSMRFNARLGLNVGTEMNYSFSEGWEIVTGAQISYSGYNILAHKVHPTFSYLYLKDDPNSISPHKYITYYGSGLGLDEVVLHNKSLQLSIPLGIKHSVWKNNNMEIKIGTSVQPSVLLSGQAYILSTDGRNYVQDDELLRTVNLIGELNSSISFQGDKVKWHVGPVVRYQALSTYRKNYPVSEHLIDYGIRIGISK